MDRSWKLRLLYKGLEIESKTDYMDLIFFSRFDYALKHITGKSMNRANSLSRRVD